MAGFNDGSASRDARASASPETIKGKLGSLGEILDEGKRQKSAEEAAAERKKRIDKEKSENVYHYSQKLSVIAKNFFKEFEDKVDTFVKAAKRNKKKPAEAVLEWNLLIPTFRSPRYKMPTTGQIEDSIGFEEVQAQVNTLNGAIGTNVVANIREMDLSKGFVLRVKVG